MSETCQRSHTQVRQMLFLEHVPRAVLLRQPRPQQTLTEYKTLRYHSVFAAGTERAGPPGNTETHL